MFRLCMRGAGLQTQLNPALRQLTSRLRSHNSWNKMFERTYAIRVTDDADSKLETIYIGPLTPQIKSVKIFSLSSSIAGLIAQPIILREAATIGSTSLIVALCSVVGFFTFVTPLLLHLITKKYVIEIKFDQETSTYKATTINFFMARKLHEFKSEDVEVPDIPGMFTTMKVKGTPLFMEARFFSEPWHYAKMMGYDKPLDFKLGNSESEENK